MSLISYSTAYPRRFSFLISRVQAFFMERPEWRAWLLSLLSWAYLVIELFTTLSKGRGSGPAINCMPSGTIEVHEQWGYELQSILKEKTFSSVMLTTVSNGFVPWTIMVIAMMFPLLNEPMRHVAFSLKRKDRGVGILAFLIGYTITWSIAGAVFLLLPFFLVILVSEQNHFVRSSAKASFFLLTAVLSWLPERPKRLAECGQTMPLRIQRWQLVWDTVSYGFKVGFTCLKMCWATMAALVLANHNLLLMYIVTIVLIYERYLLRHTSRFPAYAWATIATVLFGISVGQLFD